MDAKQTASPSAFDYNVSLANLNRLTPDAVFYLFKRWNEDSPEGRAKLVAQQKSFQDFATVLIPGAEQRQFSPPWKHLTQAPTGVYARILDELVPVKYLADCGSSGGQCNRNMVIYCGAWRYAEDILGFKGLVDLTVH